MICKNCNREIPNDSEYCSFCGNVTRSVIPSNNASSLKKGYTYLELKQWKDAEQFFRDVIINDENVAEAYIGKILARYKIDSIENLAASGKKISSDNDFKLAVKYADDEYANCLKECALKSNSKTKKRKIIISSICACVAVIALLAYFVFIPLNRISNYKDLLDDVNVQKAVQSYTKSKWFEYDQKAKDLFYENGIKLVEAKDYKNAEICLKITNGYTDNEKYLNYCKAQNLLADNDLESYNYFTDLGDFLDSKEILSTNKYFITINKLQGKWKYSETPLSVIDKYMVEQGYKVLYEQNEYLLGDGRWGFATKRVEAKQKVVEISGLVIRGDFNGKLEINSSDTGIGIYDGSLWSHIEKLDEESMYIDGRNGSGIYACVEWKKLNKTLVDI